MRSSSSSVAATFLPAPQPLPHVHRREGVPPGSCSPLVFLGRFEKTAYTLASTPAFHGSTTRSNPVLVFLRQRRRAPDAASFRRRICANRWQQRGSPATRSRRLRLEGPLAL